MIPEYGLSPRSRTIVGFSNEIPRCSARRRVSRIRRVAGHQLRVPIGHVEEGLDQDLDPGAAQVVDSDLVLLLPTPGCCRRSSRTPSRNWIRRSGGVP